MVEHGIRYLLHRLGRNDFTVHGFRSSFRDWAAERHYSDAVAEACLAHTVSDAVVRAYKRTRFDDDRRQLMHDWANYLTSPTADANVIQIQRGRK